MKKVVPDVRFLEFLQDLSEKYLQEKDKYGVAGSGGGIAETMLASSSSSGGSTGSNSSMASNGDNGVGGKSANGPTILHDPIKLIRMYSKSKHFQHSHYDPPSQQSQRAN